MVTATNIYVFQLNAGGSTSTNGTFSNVDITSSQNVSITDVDGLLKVGESFSVEDENGNTSTYTGTGNPLGGTGSVAFIRDYSYIDANGDPCLDGNGNPITVSFTGYSNTINATDGDGNSVIVMRFYYQSYADEFANFLANAPSDAVGFTSGAVVGASYGMTISSSGGILCFAEGTKITTDWGHAPIENLAVGDMVLTQDKKFLPISWISSSHLSADDLAQNPKLRPIRIRAGALGQNLPQRDLVVSPQHRILVRSRIAERMFDQTEVLVAAKDLLGVEGVDVAEDLTEVRYYHFLFQQHEVVFAEGTPSESLYTGPEALKSVSEDERQEILSIFPELKSQDELSPPKRARVFAAGRLARQLVNRHAKNKMPLLANVVHPKVKSL